MQPLAYTIADVAQIARTGRTKLYAEINAGRLRVVRIGRKTLIRDEELRRWLKAHEVGTEPAGRVTA